MTVGLGIRAGLLEVSITVSVWFSFVAPDDMPVRATVCAAAFSLVTTLPKAFSVGDALVALMGTAYEASLEKPLS